MVQCCKALINLAKYPPEKAKILHKDLFQFFLRDEELVSKSINDSNFDLNEFTASKVQENGKLKGKSKVHQASGKRTTSNPSSFDETPMDRIVTQQVSKKTKEII